MTDGTLNGPFAYCYRFVARSIELRPQRRVPREYSGPALRVPHRLRAEPHSRIPWRTRQAGFETRFGSEIADLDFVARRFTLELPNNLRQPLSGADRSSCHEADAIMLDISDNCVFRLRKPV